jgi:HSP20 family protein
MNLIRHRNPSELGLRSEMEDLFDRFFRDWPLRPGMVQGEYWPAMDIGEEGNKLVVRAELPGLKPEEVEINVAGDTLTISGEKKTDKKEEKENFFYRERRYGAFRRTVQLPASVDAEHVEASYHDGVLTVTLPKDQKSMPRRVEVKS